MMKFPKKVEGLEHVHVDGSILVCQSTGKTWQGKPTLAWYHKSNGEQAMRSVNGVVSYIPSTIPIQQANVERGATALSDVSSNVVSSSSAKEFEGAIKLEAEVFEMAWGIAVKRYPQMNTTLDVFGMIVNSIVMRLFEARRIR
jgi:hypothetical protein